MIYVRKAVLTDLETIMQIFEEARILLATDGSTQWQNGQPNQSTFKQDIENQECYVLIVSGQIAGMATLKQEGDPNYQQITAGEWHSHKRYVALHRVAISNEFRGKHLTSNFFSNLFTVIKGLGINTVRIDTHELNKRMQKVIINVGFIYCGIIYIARDPDPKRLAYDIELT